MIWILPSSVFGETRSTHESFIGITYGRKLGMVERTASKDMLIKQSVRVWAVSEEGTLEIVSGDNILHVKYYSKQFVENKITMNCSILYHEVNMKELFTISNEM